MDIKTIIAALVILMIAVSAFERSECLTDTECEIPEERNCLFLCN